MVLTSLKILRPVSFPFLITLALMWMCSALSGVTCVAQDLDLNFVRYTIQDGLSDNYCKTIDQDDHGYIWVGTAVGLNRFDGKHFRLPDGLGGNMNALRSKDIRKVLVADHSLFVATHAGLFRLNTDTYALQEIGNRDTSSFSIYSSSYTNIGEGDGFITTSTASGFQVFGLEGEKVYDFQGFAPEDVATNRMMLFSRMVFPLSNDSFLVRATNGSLFLYSKKTNSSTSTTPANGLSGFEPEGLPRCPDRNPRCPNSH